MNKKFLFLFLTILLVAPVFVSANPFWDFLTGYAAYSNRMKVSINNYILNSGTNTIKVTVSGERIEKVLINVKTPASWFGRYVVRNGKMKCVSNKCYSSNCREYICTYNVYVNRGWGRNARIYIKAYDSRGKYRYAFKTVRVRTSPIMYFCRDSDGGKDYGKKGTTRDRYGSHTDFCYSGKLLREYYCRGSRTAYIYYSCKYKCQDGACVKPPVSDCRDSDGGRNYYVAGSVGYTGPNDRAGILRDSCSGKYLTEYYCSGNKVAKTTYYCKYGCKDRACLKAPVSDCRDSDGGKNYYVAGSVAYTGPNYLAGIMRDSCSGNYLTEYYCSGNEVAKTTYYCRYGCSNGACKKAPVENSCRDSDGGKNYYVAGKVSFLNSSVAYNSSDFCVASDEPVLLHSGESKYIGGSKVALISANSQESSVNLEVNGRTFKVYPGQHIGKIYIPKIFFMNIPSPKAVVELYLEGDQYLIEQYCMGNTPKSKTYKCSLGCSNGACTKLQVKSCEDSDGGKNYYVAGSVAYTGPNYLAGIMRDSCSGNYLTEYYCSGNEVAKTNYYCRYGCKDGACLNGAKTNSSVTNVSVCEAGEWKCDSNWPKYAYACVNNQWVNIGEVPPAPRNGAWVCAKKTGKLSIISLTPVGIPKVGVYCNYNNNPWKCKISDWPGKAYFCVNHKWVKIEIPPAPPQSKYVCQNNEVKIIS